MIDRREQILTCIEGILAGVSGVRSVARNRGLLDNDVRPGLVLLDGDEQERSPRPAGSSTGRQGMVPTIMRMQPQVFIVMDVRKPQNANLGQDMNVIRTAIIGAFASDAELQSLVGTNGDIVYNGCETDLKSGSTLDGTARLDFSLTYPLIPL